MRNLFTALAFISSVSLSIAGVSANQPYDFGVSIVELSDSTTTDDFENKKMELILERSRKNHKAFRTARIEQYVLAGGIGIYMLTSMSSNSSSSGPSYAVDLGPLEVAWTALWIGHVVIGVKLICTLLINQTSYQKSLKKFKNSVS